MLLFKPATPDEVANSGWQEGEVIDFKHEIKCWTRGKIEKMTTNSGIITVDISNDGVMFKYDLGSDDFTMNVGKCGSKYRGAMEACESNNGDGSSSQNSSADDK